MLFRIALTLSLVALAVDAGRAANIPPPKIYASILSKLASFNRNRVHADRGEVDSIVSNAPREMRFVDDGGRNLGSYSVLLEGHRNNPTALRAFCAVLSCIAVDTNGSPYPDYTVNPNGTGTCPRVRRDNCQDLLDAISAEKLINGDAQVFLNEKELSRGVRAAKLGGCARFCAIDNSIPRT